MSKTIEKIGLTFKKVLDVLVEIPDLKTFTVYFTKKSGDETRKMICQYGVVKDLKGKGLSYDRAAKELLGVFDMEKQEYRTIYIPGLLWVEYDGTRYLVNPKK